MTFGAADDTPAIEDETLALKLSRIEACSIHIRDDLGRNLLHAYVACLSASELRTATFRYLEADKVLIRALRTRLIRVGNDGCNTRELDRLSADLIALPAKGRRVGPRTDSLLSAIYPFLSVEARKAILDRWIDRGNKAAAARWLKAMANDALLLDVELAWGEWQASREPLPAKIFIQHATGARIAEALPELIAHAAEGWLVSKAALKTPTISEKSWRAIRRKFPATYAYLCSKLHRPLTQAEAFAIVEETTGGPFGDRGLAIWSIGQMKMMGVLDELTARYDEFLKREMEMFLHGSAPLHGASDGD
ncbi:conserved hypothetical protein [Mesorhizobium plurifarium]|uniref:Uncharacterized protein n=1 Tax=Mesorhizobium plurifarium TaxID=69974 RepID=A0A090FC17_MESPL|nr:conserved hypothetical protein [Mesorhizobium plurifarium]